MKYKLLILGLICLIYFSCVSSTPKNYKFEVGEIVFVLEDAYVVDYVWHNGDCTLKKLDCHGQDCKYRVKESEIKKEK